MLFRSPVTGTNWEGTGVVPDISVPADRAYDVAYGLALRHVLAAADAAEPGSADDAGDRELPPAVPPPVADEARAALASLGDGHEPADGTAGA